MVLIRWDFFFLLWAGMMVFHLVTYFGSQYLEGEPHTVGGALDERIPFHPGWIYIYSSWFVLLLGVPGTAQHRCAGALSQIHARAQH